MFTGAFQYRPCPSTSVYCIFTWYIDIALHLIKFMIPKAARPGLFFNYAKWFLVHSMWGRAWKRSKYMKKFACGLLPIGLPRPVMIFKTFPFHSCKGRFEYIYTRWTNSFLFSRVDPRQDAVSVSRLDLVHSIWITSVFLSVICCHL